MIFILLVLVVVLGGLKLANMSARIQRLEDQVAGRAQVPAKTSVQPSPQVVAQPMAQPAAPMVAANIAPTQPIVQTEPQVPQVIPKARPSGPSLGQQFVTWFKEDWLLKMGALFLLMGVGWFISYAFIHNWIGPAGRIAIGVVIGLLIMALGYARMKQHVHQGEIFLVVGATTILLTLNAARSVYGFFTPVTAMMMMFVIAAVVAVISVRENNRTLAVSGLVMALLAPLFAGAYGVDNIGLFTYLIAIMLGTMWIVALRNQRVLVSIALFGVWFFSLAVFDSIRQLSVSDQYIMYGLAGICAAIIYIGSVLINTKENRESDGYDVVSALGVGALVWAWSVVALEKDWQSGALLLWAILFVVGALYAYAFTKKHTPLLLYGGVSAVLFGVALSLEFDGATLTNAWTLEAAVLAIVTLLITRKISAARIASLAFIAPIARSFLHIRWYGAGSFEDAIALLLLSVAFFATGALFYYLRTEGGEAKSSSVACSALGMVYLLLATAVQFSDTTLIMVWSLEVALFVLAVYLVEMKKHPAQIASIAFIVPILGALPSVFSSSWELGIMHQDMLVLMVLAVVLMALGVLLRGHDTSENGEVKKGEVDGGAVLLVLSSIYFATILWLSSPTIFSEEFAVMGSLVIYTLFGLFFYMSGRMHSHAEQRTYGATVLGLVIARLLMVDVWGMELAGKIVTFLLIGTLLMSTAFIGRSSSEKRQIPPQ